MPKAGKMGFTVNCDADGFHQSLWKSTKCKGDADFNIDYAWGKCEKLPMTEDGEPRWIKVKTKADYDDLTNLQVVKHGYNSWAKEHCITLFEHYNFGGRSQTHCLDP